MHQIWVLFAPRGYRQRGALFLGLAISLLSQVSYGQIIISGEVTKPQTLQAADLKAMPHTQAQFERTLISTNSPYDRYLQGTYALTASEKRGFQLFTAAPNPTKGIRGGILPIATAVPNSRRSCFTTMGWKG